MRKLGLLVVVLLLAVAPAGLAQATGSRGYSVTSSRELYPGVRFFTMGSQKRSQDVFVARLAPGAAVSLRPVGSNDRVTNEWKDLELPSSMCRRVRCIVGVNGDFATGNEPVGGVVTGGRMVRSPSRQHPQLTMTRDGHLVTGSLPWSGALTRGGETLGVDAVNATPLPDQVVLFTSDWGARTRASKGSELVLRTGGPLGILGQPSAVELLRLGSPGSAVPRDGAVLSASGAGADRLRRFWDKVHKGPGMLRVDSPVTAVESIGGNPVLLRNGRPAFPPAKDGFTGARHPRTLVGWNAGGEVFMVAVDGRSDDSRGMTLAEAADFLLRLGATEGLNLDGGGGTTFVVDGSVANHPSDDGDRRTDSVERGATNALVVVPRPSAPSKATDGRPATSLPPATGNLERPNPFRQANATPGTSDGAGPATATTAASPDQQADPSPADRSPVEPSPAGPSTTTISSDPPAASPDLVAIKASPTVRPVRDITWLWWLGSTVALAFGYAARRRIGRRIDRRSLS